MSEPIVLALTAFLAGAFAFPLSLFVVFRAMFPVEATGYGNAGFWAAVTAGASLAAVCVWFKPVLLWIAALAGPSAVLGILIPWFVWTIRLRRNSSFKPTPSAWLVPLVNLHMADWSIPNWGEPWQPEVEVPLLQSLASEVTSRWPHIQCRPDFTTVGSAFVEFFSGSVCVGRAYVSVIDRAAPYFSCYLGASEDEFHGHNTHALAALVGHYHDGLPDGDT